MNFFENCSIRSKVARIILAASVPVMVAGLFQMYTIYQANYREAQQAIRSAVAVVSLQHEAQIEAVRKLLTTLSKFPEVQRLDTPASTALLRGVLKEYPANSNIGIVDVRGEVIASGVDAAFTVADRKYFQDALRTKAFSAGEFVISRAVARPAIHFAQPVLDAQGRIKAVIYATYDLSIFDRVLDAQKLPPGSALNLTDHQGRIMHRYPSSPRVTLGDLDRPDLWARMVGPAEDGVFDDFGRDGLLRLLAFKRMRLRPGEAPYMYIRVSIPKTAAFARMYQVAGLSILLLATVWTLAVVLSRILAGQYLVAPLEEIARVAKAAGHGDYTLRTGLASRPEEIGQLAQAIDAMTLSLATRRRERAQNDLERQRMERVLRESERRFRELLERVHMVAVILDLEGRITFCNDFLLTLTGWDRAEVLGRSWFEVFLAPEFRDVVQEVFAEARQAGSVPSHFENPILTKDGQQRIIIWDNTLLRDAAGAVTGTASLGMDVTQHRAMEHQLLQAQKMEAVGRLAGGVAHDFNNLLTPILGYAELLREDLLRAGFDPHRVDRIAQAAGKARDLTQQLLSFGRKQPMDMRTVDLNALVDAFVPILYRTIRESIHIRLDLGPGPLLVRADRTRLEQIIMNLMVNAQDAIADQGTIILRTALVTLTEEDVHGFPEAQPGPHVLLQVADTGRGIDPQALAHVFEPFFTTKTVGKGTGLGLATVYGIVKQHGGSIRLASAPDRGSTFNIHLPLTGEPCPAPDPEPAPPAPAPVRSGTILLVEDNEHVRSLAYDLLAGLGYEVLVAEDPQAALTLAAERTLHLLVSDVVMPGMSGPELYQRLLETKPGLKVLFMSGYTSNIVAQQGQWRENANFIQKPFAIELLSRKVAELIVP